MKQKLLTSLEEHLESQYGKRGTPEREKFETEYEKFKADFLKRKRRNAPRRKPGSKRTLTFRFK